MRNIIVDKFDLMNFYDSEFKENALRELGDNTIAEINEDGTITIAFMVTTSWFHPKQESIHCKIMVQRITEFYIEQLDKINKQLNNESASNYRKFIEERYNINKRELRIAENNFREFQENNNTVSIEEQTNALVNIAASIKAEILSNQVKKEILDQSLPNNHPDILAIENEIDLLKNQLNNLYTGSDSDFLFPKFDQVPDIVMQYLQLKRDVEVQNELFIFLTQQFEEAKIKEAKDTPTIQILDDPVVPELKYKPHRIKLVIIGFAFSLIITLYYIYFRYKYYEYRRNKYYTV